MAMRMFVGMLYATSVAMISRTNSVGRSMSRNMGNRHFSTVIDVLVHMFLMNMVLMYNLDMLMMHFIEYIN